MGKLSGTMSLATWMKEHGITPEAVATAAGVHPVTVYNWRRGRKLPNAERVHAIAERTGIPPHVLRPDRPDLFPPPATSSVAA